MQVYGSDHNLVSKAHTKRTHVWGNLSYLFSSSWSSFNAYASVQPEYEMLYYAKSLYSVAFLKLQNLCT
jgi:hypothetical protein